MYIEQRKASQITISLRQLAREMDRNPSSISRELKRNFDPDFGFYSGIRAQTISVVRRKSGIIKKIDRIADTIREVLFGMLQERTSPEQICGRLKHKHGIRISYATLYRYINANKLNGGKLYLNLRHGTTKYRRNSSKYNACAIVNKKRIEQRPIEAAEKKEAGH